jgi:hypothetical protein
LYVSWSIDPGASLFKGNVEANIEALIELARRGESRPDKHSVLGRGLIHYTSPKHGCYRVGFSEEIRTLVPHWFVRGKPGNVDSNRQALLEMARRGEPRPLYRTPLGKALGHYTDPNSSSYRRVFEQEIKTLAPSWLTYKRHNVQGNIEALLESARRGEPKPRYNHPPLGRPFFDYTYPASRFYRPELTEELRKLAPHWFSQVTEEQKELYEANRQAALEKGLHTFEGAPCLKCGSTTRYVKSNHQCLECGRHHRAESDKNKQREYDKQYRADNLERIKAKETVWRNENRERLKEFRQIPAIKERAAQVSKEYGKTARGKRLRKIAYLRRMYNLDIEQYEAWLKLPCPVCEGKLDSDATGIDGIAVDHDHECCSGHRSCGKCVRGLLHKRCNLGHLKDDPKLLHNKAAYLEKWRNSKRERLESQQRVAE